MAKAPFEIHFKKIYSGKLRRYHNVSLARQLLDVPTVLKNVRDVFLVGVGFLQSLRFLRKTKPDAVFTKGGFVCLPVGLAAKFLKIPLIIHDSDAHAGLTNRILAKYATAIATGAPLSNYNYPKDKTRYVGVPVSAAFRPLTPKAQKQYKAQLGLHNTNKPLLVVTGGGLGARNLNRVITTIAPKLLEDVAILHITGEKKYQEVLASAPEHIDYLIKPFLPEGFEVAFGAADIVVTRAGATTMAELAAMSKAVIVVPSPYLAGGHQLKNAQMFAKKRAAVVIQEEAIILDSRKLTKIIRVLCAHPDKRQQLGERLHHFGRPDAALDTAMMIVDAVYTAKTPTAT